MTSKKLYIHYFLIGILVAGSVTAFAQKKKKGPEEVQASASRLREAEFYFTEGEKFFILEDYAKALSYYEKTLEINPDNATVHYKIAEVLSQGGRPEDLQRAALSIDHALRLESENKYFYLLGANIYAALSRYDKAARIYESLIQNVPGSEEYLYELAAVYQFANKPDEALKAYQKAENVLGVNEISSLQKQRILMDQGKVREAVAEGEKLVNHFPGDERLLMGFTEFLSQNGLRKQAITYLEKFAAENPDAVNTRILLAAFYRENNQEDKARPMLLALFGHPDVDVNSKLLIMGAYNAELNLLRAKNGTDEEKFAFAEQLFNKLLESSPSGAKTHIVGGDLYLAGGKFQRARKEYLKAIEEGDVTFEVWQNLLSLDQQLGDSRNLIQHSEAALEIFPNQGILYFFNGDGHLRAGNYDDAIAALEQGKRLSGSNPVQLADINAALGEAYYFTGDVSRSDQAFEQALAQDGVRPEVLNRYATVLIARKDKLEKAEQISAQLVKEHPGNIAFLDTYSLVLYHRGKFQEARKFIERAISQENVTATYLEHYGDILYKLGEIDAAVVQWEKARSRNTNNELLNKKIANRKIYE